MSSFFASTRNSQQQQQYPFGEQSDDDDAFVDSGEDDEPMAFFSTKQMDLENGGSVDESDPFGIDSQAAIRGIPVNDKDDDDEEEGEYDDDKYEYDDKSASTQTEPFLNGPNTLPLEQMRNNVFFAFPDWRRRTGAYYLLIFLAAVIATSGVAGDSAATVIGAMIVAPLMTPILGIVLSIVTRDCKNLGISISLVFSGAVVVVAVGFVYGLFLDKNQILKENNSQIAARVLPNLTDLIAALATGAVGSIAMVREDISNTLPGVSIAILLVPPLNVVGLTLSTGSWDDAIGAAVLFLTNVSSILFVGTCTLLLYKINLAANNIQGCCHRTFSCSVSCFLVLLMFLMLSAPLAVASFYLRYTDDMRSCVKDELTRYVAPIGLEASSVKAFYSIERSDFVAEATLVGEIPLVGEVPVVSDVPFVEVDPSDIYAVIDIGILHECEIGRLEITYVPAMKYVLDDSVAGRTLLGAAKIGAFLTPSPQTQKRSW